MREFIKNWFVNSSGVFVMLFVVSHLFFVAMLIVVWEIPDSYPFEVLRFIAGVSFFLGFFLAVFEDGECC